MDAWSTALTLLPRVWREDRRLGEMTDAEEIRLRVGQAPRVLRRCREEPFRDEPVEESLLQRVMEIATGASVHAAALALSEGFVSYRGVRIGVCGSAVVRDGEMQGFRSLSSLAIRIPRECRGICEDAAERLIRTGFRNTLIVGRPGDGKTTALRELIRRLSESGLRIGVTDERNELAAKDRGTACFDLGPCTDVLTGIAKGEGSMMLLRGMNPQILAVDEITRQADLLAIEQIHGCGVGILASAHGSDLSELSKRGAYRRLLEQGVFHWCLSIHRTGRGRSYTLEEIKS